MGGCTLVHSDTYTIDVRRCRGRRIAAPGSHEHYVLKFSWLIYKLYTYVKDLTPGLLTHSRRFQYKKRQPRGREVCHAVVYRIITEPTEINCWTICFNQYFGQIWEQKVIPPFYQSILHALTYTLLEDLSQTYSLRSLASSTMWVLDHNR